jgi:hypothetical protein
VTREELDAVRNHISNLPTVGAMYAPILVEWAGVLLRQRDEIRAQRDNLLDASKEGAWMARALDAERERDEARAENDRLKASRLPDVEYARLDAVLASYVRVDELDDGTELPDPFA